MYKLISFILIVFILISCKRIQNVDKIISNFNAKDFESIIATKLKNEETNWNVKDSNEIYFLFRIYSFEFKEYFHDNKSIVLDNNNIESILVYSNSIIIFESYVRGYGPLYEKKDVLIYVLPEYIDKLNKYWSNSNYSNLERLDNKCWYTADYYYSLASD